MEQARKKEKEKKKKKKKKKKRRTKRRRSEAGEFEQDVDSKRKQPSLDSLFSSVAALDASLADSKRSSRV